MPPIPVTPSSKTEVDKLYEANVALRGRIDNFLQQARINEEKQRKFQALEMSLLGLTSLTALLREILFPNYVTFKWDIISLQLLDPEYEIRRILAEEGHHLVDHPAIKFAAEQDKLVSLHPHSLFTSLGPYKAKQHQGLFADVAPHIPASVALLPLVRHGKLIGGLNIGSYEGERFVRGVRTDFFEHLASVLAICIENAINVERLKRIGITDTLTTVNNRRFFDQRIEEEMALALRDRQPLSCLLLDVDHFKKVNDSHGHLIGDQVLMEVAALIRGQLRGTDVLARYGGEEFVALLAHTDNGVALEVAERIRAAIASTPFNLENGSTFTVTISIGVSTLKPDDQVILGAIPGERLVGQADKALYDAKNSGRNQVCNSGLIASAENW